MATITVINPTTDAVEKVEFNTNGYHEGVSFHAAGLANDEVITPFVGGSAGWTPLYGADGNQILLTSSTPQMTVAPGAHYGFDKSASAGDVALDASLSQ